MIGEIATLVVLLAGVAAFAALAWRLTLHLIGLDSQEVAMWKRRFREWRTPESGPGMSSALDSASPTPSGVAERVERVLALHEYKSRPGIRSSE
jgi:hypothetical protein